MLTRACTLALVLLAFAGDASASQLIGREAARASLQVNAAGQAHVAWTEGGSTRHVVAENAINARPPQAGGAQVEFALRYEARSIRGGGCGRYEGPRSPGWWWRAPRPTARTGRCSAGRG